MTKTFTKIYFVYMCVRIILLSTEKEDNLLSQNKKEDNLQKENRKKGYIGEHKMCAKYLFMLCLLPFIADAHIKLFNVAEYGAIADGKEDNSVVSMLISFVNIPPSVFFYNLILNNAISTYIFDNFKSQFKYV